MYFVVVVAFALGLAAYCGICGLQLKAKVSDFAAFTLSQHFGRPGAALLGVEACRKFMMAPGFCSIFRLPVPSFW